MKLCKSALLIVSIFAMSGSLPAFCGVEYTALSDAARKAGRLDIYKEAPVSKETLELGGNRITIEVPRTARGYDSVPVSFTLQQRTEDGRSVAVEAVAFEDVDRGGGRALYDLAIPGDMKVNIEYLGSIGANEVSDGYVPLSADGKSAASPFPPFKRDEMVLSSEIKPAHLVWFKFRVTNTGDTILDPEGLGGCLVEPRLVKLDGDKKEVWSCFPVNRFIRFLEYLYPGDSVELWVNFSTPNDSILWRWGLDEGSYRIDFRMVSRFYNRFEWGTNIWGGTEFAKLTVPIEVKKNPGQVAVRGELKLNDVENTPTIFDTFEEFMTSFKIYPTSVTGEPKKDTMYLQVAPWTRHVVVKLILLNPKEIVTAKIPIEVTDETLEIKYNPDNIMVVNKGGVEEPVFLAQAMPGMRTGITHNPFPEEYMLKNLQEMKELGVNVIINTSGDWHIPEIGGRKEILWQAASYKYFYDVLVRQMDMKVMGWSLYPPSAKHWYDFAEILLGKKIAYSKTGSGYGGHSETVDMGDPAVPEVIATWAKFNYTRWGDYWFAAKDGRVPIDMEDSWGWMRDDINCRYRIGPLAIERFREWVRDKYGSIEKVNEVWGASYVSFDEIDPEKDQGEEGDGIGTAGPIYNRQDNVFHEWNAALEDFDVFRTELKMEILRKANELIREFIPKGEIELRCEGANPIIEGDGDSDNMHWRYIYYSQRRNAMVYDVVKRENVLHFFSDYATLPYTVDEWRLAMREMVRGGFVPGYLPQFDHMRDIVLNSCYGREYQLHYNLDKPSQGIMVHCLMAAYPWWKATYEEGGAPGILWEDYMCDGFATETQKRELKLLREHFNKMEKDN